MKHDMRRSTKKDAAGGGSTAEAGVVAAVPAAAPASQHGATATTKKRKRTKTSAAAAASAATRKGAAAVPKPGDEGYMTPTQLRNARKRRAKKQNGGSSGGSMNLRRHHQQQLTSSTAAYGDGGGGGIRSTDPSLRYIDDPRKAPAVRRAEAFFRNRMDAVFAVHMNGPKTGWRTVAKLAVRRRTTTSGGSGGKDGNGHVGLSIGLFRPRSHDIVPGSDSSPSHHPSINEMVSVVREAANDAEVTAYDEGGDNCGGGAGDLRYVAFQVERSTGRVQVTLVWNVGDEEGPATVEQRRRLGRFCRRIEELAADRPRSGAAASAGGDANGGGGNKNNSGRDSLLHSLWVHYNSSWRHDNAIFARSGGRWEQRSGSEPHVREHLPLATAAAAQEDGRKKRREKMRKKSEAPTSARGRSVPTPTLFFPPQVFRQANIDAFSKIVLKIRQYLESYSSKSNGQLPSCVELYGGVGEWRNIVLAT